MTEGQQNLLCETLKRLGYGRNNQIRLYGDHFDVTSDPIVVGERLVFVDAVEKRSGRSRRVRIPLNVLHMAGQNVAA
jgi:hypothetical protein